jgi:hypothetical protein
MTIHYFGADISPRSVLYTLAGKHFCVSFEYSGNTEVCHRIGSSVMLDNGAYTFWRNHGCREDWTPYYDWVRPWLEVATTWAVIPDVIDGDEAMNNQLIGAWYHAPGNYRRAAPVWHLDESFPRLERLSRNFERICIGSAGAFAEIGSDAWNNRMNETFNFLCKGSGYPPCWVHMLRGMQLSTSIYPFHSVDSSSIARNYRRDQKVDGKTPSEMMNDWESRQCPIRWTEVPVRQSLFEKV